MNRCAVSVVRTTINVTEKRIVLTGNRSPNVNADPDEATAALQLVSAMLATLLYLSMAMFVGSFFAGLVPLFVVLPERRLAQLTLYGAGLLVGAALIVVVPEGMHVALAPKPSAGVHASCAEAHLRTGRGFHAALMHNNSMAKQQALVQMAEAEATKAGMLLLRKAAAATGSHEASAVLDKLIKNHGLAVSHNGWGRRRSLQRRRLHGDEGDEQAEDAGIWLALGFAVLLCAEQLSATSGGHAHSHGDTEAPQQPQQQQQRPPPTQGTSVATKGLLIHAFADGIALGAASVGSTGQAQGAIFVALLVHKAPAAFGLTAHLLGRRCSRSQVRRQLFLFAAAAPVGALATYGGAELLGVSSGSRSTGVHSFVARSLLFSGGSFLYVACGHVVPEAVSGALSKQILSRKELCGWLLAGLLSPALL